MAVEESQNDLISDYRDTEQFLMPYKLEDSPRDLDFEIYPYHSLGPDKISLDIRKLIDFISQEKVFLLEGFVGVFWEDLKTEIEKSFNGKIKWISTYEFFKSESELYKMVSPYLGEKNSIWGQACDLDIKDYLVSTNFLEGESISENDLTIVYGPGASLCSAKFTVAYVDLPKNELQFRMRAGKASNLGFSVISEASNMYKHYYFIDWKVLNRHKKAIQERITVFLDGQRLGVYPWAFSEDIFNGLDDLSQNPIRVRPWFEPGAWGGQWIKKNIPGLNKDVVNYAWAFSLIVPENGLLFESEKLVLEISFDFLMFRNRKNVLGKHAERFGDEFPIRFNFLDTFNGGNLSIQCHPNTAYIKEEFGENFTQDETYYILDTQDDAKVYLGFQQNINKQEFREVLENSQSSGEAIDITKYVQEYPSQKHDLFLIPNETIHSSGKGNMVLEISATPYIFTFKMYDWVRLDLNGKPRPINIEHAFKNLNFQRKGEMVEKELISKPYLKEENAEYTVTHYPTHREHFYDIERIEFDERASFRNDEFYVMMIVEGEAIKIETADNQSVIKYAETFVIPASMEKYTLINLGENPVKIIRAFIKSTNH